MTSWEIEKHGATFVYEGARLVARVPQAMRAAFAEEVAWRKAALTTRRDTEGMGFGPPALRQRPNHVPRAGRCLTCYDVQRPWDGGMCWLCNCALRAVVLGGG